MGGEHTPLHGHHGHEWQHGLFSCPDTGNCIYACFCPHCATSSARSRFDGSNCIFNFLCVSTPVAMNIMREGYGIEGDCCTDILTPLFCPCCTAARLLNEVESRGPVKKGMH